MTLPAVEPFPADGDLNFNSKAHACMDSLRAFSLAAATELSTVSAAVATVSAGLGADLWVSGTSYALGDLVISPADGYLYRRLVAGGGTSDPSLDPTNWALQTLPAPTLITVTGTAVTGANGVHHELVNAAGSEYTLPASPAVGTVVWFGFANGLTSGNYVRRNAQKIMGFEDDLLVDVAFFSAMARFIGGATGWRLYT